MKPKNYSRKITKDGFICSCLCPIRIGIASKNFDYEMIKYEIVPNKNDYKYSKYSSATFKKIVELPKYFNQLENGKDYRINTSHFIRDGVQVPCVHNIEIVNVEKYKTVKNKEFRKKKLIQLEKLDI